MVTHTLTRSLTRLLPILLVLLHTSALNFTIQSVNCTQLDWTLSLTQPEWSVASYIDIFFVSTLGGQNYSVLYSALEGGDFPRPGTYDMVTRFGNTMLSGGYRIGVGLADGGGNLLTTASGAGGGVQQVTSVDGRTFTADCLGVSSTRSTAAVVNTTATQSLTATSMASSTVVTRTSSTSLASATSTSTTAAPAAATSTTLTSTTTNPTTFSSTHSINKSALAGGIVGGVLLLLLSLALLRWCTSRRRTRQAAHRLSGLRSLELCEKQPSGFPSPHQRDAKAYASRDTLDASAFGSLSGISESSRLPYGAYAARSGSLNNFPAEETVKVVHVPPHFDTVSPHISSNSTNTDLLPKYPPRSLVINLPSPTISPLTSPTRSVRPSPSTSQFKIPRVSVPTYNADGGLSRSSSGRGPSRAATVISMDGEDGEDPFVDAEQEQRGDGGYGRD